MTVFIASSTENLRKLDDVAEMIEELGHQVIRWNDIDVFVAGENTMETLMNLRHQVNAAIFLYSSDDKTWYHNTITTQPRDNVLFEHGLFMGALGLKRAIIIKTDNDVKIPTDLYGLTYIHYTSRNRTATRNRLRVWLNKISKVYYEPSPAIDWDIDYSNFELMKYYNAQDHMMDSICSCMDSLYEIYLTPQFETSTLEEVVLLILTTFVNSFWGIYDARFTLREYREETNTMDTLFTTRQDSIPGPIPLDDPNMITESVNQGRPLVYSDNPQFHYNTKNASIGTEYVDYVSYALMCDENNIPIWSLCLDVKNKNDSDKLKVLVHSFCFEFVCSFIITKLQLEIEKRNGNN